MKTLKVLAVGAGMFAATQWIASQSFISGASPTVAKFAPYLIAGGILVGAEHFGLV